MRFERIPVLLRGTWFGLNRAFRAKLSGVGVTSSQYTILRCIYESSGCEVEQRELAHLIFSNKNNLASALMRLENVGFVFRKNEKNDARRRIVHLTDEGKKVFLKAKTIADSLQSQIKANLGEDDFGKLILYLSKCEQNFISDL
ncbi:MAG: hypothetical protein CBC00_02775 [Verrucomicrobia bacterium TMED40]|nr:MAG: hypothetical protein CBC00_02775 [Verrucomicrobia bacterium TMED40]|tara:strand:- start:305 stop:736 length:432 start_codon:yes stop_codon:yes gene_type:complete